jgi:glycosyltransferase involved in cell wall biosynthesis
MGTKILIASHSPLLTTGYGRVTRTLARALTAAGHDVAVLGFGYENEPHALGHRLLPWAAVEDVAVIGRTIEVERPAMLITIGDPWMFAGVPGSAARRGVKWVAYFPVDGFPLPAEWRRWIAAVDLPVVFCRWTADLVERETGVRPAVVPHGVDTTVFAPADKAAAKARVGVAGRFVVGCVAVNQQRKNLPALVRAFAAFARDKDDATLYLHTQIAGYWDVEELVRRFGVEPKTRATLNLDPTRGVGDDVLATIYNAMDVFVLPTMAEGFGLPIVESQACGVPALVTDFSSCSELVPEAACRLRVAQTLIMARNFEQAVVDEADVAAKLERLYHDPVGRRRLAARCLAFARGFGWERACEAFVGLLGRA